MQSLKSVQNYFYIITIIVSPFLNYIKNLFTLAVCKYVSYKKMMMQPLNKF